MAHNIWTTEQLIMALNVYCKIPFKDVRESHPIIQKYAPLIGRSETALKMKIGNFGRFDPALQVQGITGLKHGSKAEEEVWDAFWNDPNRFSYESELLLAQRAEEVTGKNITLAEIDYPEGTEKEILVRQRVNQNFFRETVLSSYMSQCCITGLKDRKLLEACHIVSWVEDTKNRTNPKNGLCMNPLFHKAYDKHLIGISPDYRIVVSNRLLCETSDKHFYSYLKTLQGRKIYMPEKFHPDTNLLDRHYGEYIRRI